MVCFCFFLESFFFFTTGTGKDDADDSAVDDSAVDFVGRGPLETSTGTFDACLVATANKSKNPVSSIRLVPRFRPIDSKTKTCPRFSFLESKSLNTSNPGQQFYIPKHLLQFFFLLYKMSDGKKSAHSRFGSKALS